jgi:type VI secretion system secreted protein Hcp
MANRFYVTIRGTKQGQFKGDDVHGPQGNKIAGLAFRYGLASPHDAQGLATGRRQHDSVLLVKEWDAASPQIFQAIATNEVITEVNFEFLKTTAAGVDSLYYTIKLTNASIVKVSMHVDAPTPGAPGDTRELEEVSFVFQTAAADDARGTNGVSTAATGQTFSRVTAGGPSLAEEKLRVAASAPLLSAGGYPQATPG